MLYLFMGLSGVLELKTFMPKDTDANNIPARRCYEAVGFREAPASGEIFSAFGEEWKCLEMEIKNFGGCYERKNFNA